MHRCLIKDIAGKVRERIFLLITLGMIFGLGTMALGAQREQAYEAYYESVIIHSGDTLWKIAKEYKAENEKIEHMIYKIMEINGMRSENIMSGESIIVPMKR